MHTNQFDPTTYLYSYVQQRWVKSFDNEDQLLDYLATHYTTFFGEKNQVNLTWKDVYTWLDYNELTTQKSIREYILVDSLNRVLNPADYRAKVDAMIASLPAEKREQYEKWGNMGLMHMWRRHSKTKKVQHRDLQYGDMLHTCNTDYRYRQDPVPGVGRNRWHFGFWYRLPSTTPELRDMANPENQSFIRKRRKQIPTAYDDIPKCCQRSWKEQSKKRKQWM